MPHSGQDNEPYCSNCGYQLTGLTESSKCPECGRPLVEILTRRSQWGLAGKRYRSKTVIFGLPLVHIAMGPRGNERKGRAKGIIAIGDVATGFLAMGGIARGVIAVGGLAFGLVAFGGLAAGLAAGFGGLAVGGIASGGGAVGVVAQGGVTVGVLADGGAAYGYLARGAQARGRHTSSAAGRSPGAGQRLARWGWLIGRPGTFKLTLWAVGLAAGIALAAALLVLAGYLAGGRTSDDGDPTRRA